MAALYFSSFGGGAIDGLNAICELSNCDNNSKGDLQKYKIIKT